MNGIMRLILVAAVSVGVVATAQAQWPLGKELSVQEGKSTESGTLCDDDRQVPNLCLSPGQRSYVYARYRYRQSLDHEKRQHIRRFLTATSFRGAGRYSNNRKIGDKADQKW